MAGTQDVLSRSSKERSRLRGTLRHVGTEGPDVWRPNQHHRAPRLDKRTTMRHAPPGRVVVVKCLATLLGMSMLAPLYVWA